MDKTSKQIIQNLMNELALERQLADQLAEALIEGGMDRQFQALTFHEHTRNGFMYGKTSRSVTHQSHNRRSVASDQVTRQLKWQRPDKDNKDFWTGFDL
jgi:hypothetical protein